MRSKKASLFAMSFAKTCSCGAQFDIADDDLAFYAKVSPRFGGKVYNIPPPTLCPDCRQQRRLAFRDERKLYKRKCDATGVEMITIYSQDKPFKVYNKDYYWSDAFDATEYGRDFDFSRPFFAQFAELLQAVPKLQYSAYNNENCPYMNRCSNCRNCYMCFNLDFGENSLYSQAGYKLINSVDCAYSKVMELCAYCTDSHNCYESTELIRCSSLADSHFCFDCHASHDLILCWNLRNKSYCIANEQLTKEEFLRRKAEMNLQSRPQRKALEESLKKYARENAIHKFANILKSEECTGDNIFESKNCHECFDVLKGEDLKRVFSVDNDAKDARDSEYTWEAELCYETMSTNRFQIAFSFNVWECSEVFYSAFCKSSAHLFGCVGLKRAKYCILNKPYTKEQYEALVPKIIEHMQKTGEWGEFFPMTISPFAYNETVAQEYYPLTRVEAEARGLRWQEEPPPPQARKTIPANKLPDTIDKIPDDVLNWAILCEKTQRPFIIQKMELEFYRKMNLPLPHLHPDERHKARMAKRNPRKLWARTCAECGTAMQTSYAPDRPERVLCEECYLKEVN